MFEPVSDQYRRKFRCRDSIYPLVCYSDTKLHVHNLAHATEDIVWRNLNLRRTCGYFLDAAVDSSMGIGRIVDVTIEI